MRTRKQLINDLIDASDFKDSEIVLNSGFIRDLFNDAVGQLKDATKIAADNKRHLEHIKKLKAGVQQLEATVSEKEKVIAELSGKIGRLQAECDALLTFMQKECYYCKHNFSAHPDCPCMDCDGESHFEWRGVPKEE